MSESLKSSSEKEDPSSLLRILGRKIKGRFFSTPEAVALHEAVDELIEETEKEGGAPAAERVFLNNILTLREKEVGDCMLPRAQINAIDIDSSMQELVDMMTEHSHTRVPVYRETLDEMLGMIHLKDVVGLLAESKTKTLAELLRPVFFAAPSMPVSKLLIQMRQTRQHMAMVVDEFGGIDGLVTIEDLVEEIVGEIEDEHDDPERIDVIVRSDGSAIVSAAMTTEDFEKRAGQILSEEEREAIDTLGGYVFHLAGHVPLIGETVKGPEGLIFDVLETDQNRIKRVRIRGCKFDQDDS